jgi:hypothetical protein
MEEIKVKQLSINNEEMECYMLGYLLQIYTDFLETYMKKEDKNIHCKLLKYKEVRFCYAKYNYSLFIP